MSARARVGIFDADVPTAVAFVRSLGAAGVPLRVYSHKRWPVCRLSRWCVEFARCPDPADAEQFQPWLEGELRSGRIDLVAPTSDLIAYAVANLRDAFAPGLRARFEPAQGVLDCLFKDRFDSACARLGFRTPWSACPRTVAEARELAPTYRYPAILKPKSHVGVGIARGQVVRDAAELRAAVCEYPLPATEARLYPELALPMVQEYVPGALDNLYSVSGVLAGAGEVIAAAATRKMAQWPPTLGIGIDFRPVDDPGLVAAGAALAAGVLGRGIFEVELIRDLRTGEWVAIDLNPRAHGFIRLDIERGHDLPLLWYRIATGERVAPQPPPRQDVAWRHGVPHAVRRGIGRLRRAPREPVPEGHIVDIVHDARDPWPTLPFLASMLRHPGGLVRPFWRAPEADARAPAEPAPNDRLAIG